MLADAAFLRGRTREPDTRTLKEAQDPPSVEATGNSSPKIRGTFGGPHNKDSNISGSILGSPYLR